MTSISPIEIECFYDAPVETLWTAWTTEEGIKSFFAPGCRVEPKVGGAYEIYFNPDAEKGERGAEGARILALEPMSFLSFSWNNPPTIPKVRWQYALVCLYFEAVDKGRTRLRLVHQGWGMGEDWEKARMYFNRAWNQVVLPRLNEMLANGPADWEAG